MASRFNPSTLHQRDPRSALFQNYTPRHTTSPSSPSSSSSSHIHNNSNKNNVHNDNNNPYASSSRRISSSPTQAPGVGGFRPATPNSRGQYSDAVLSELENQNDTEIQGLSGKVRMLKDISLAISAEITSSTSLAEKMNDNFDNTRVRLRGTMNRMLRMAERTGVGWRVWMLFILAVMGVFSWVWLF